MMIVGGFLTDIFWMKQKKMSLKTWSRWKGRMKLKDVGTYLEENIGCATQPLPLTADKCK